MVYWKDTALTSLVVGSVFVFGVNATNYFLARQQMKEGCNPKYIEHRLDTNLANSQNAFSKTLYILGTPGRYLAYEIYYD